MELTVLRARAICASCQSRLPPRSEAWYDAASGSTWCVTCERYERMERMEAEAAVEAVERFDVEQSTAEGGTDAVDDRPADPVSPSVDLLDSTTFEPQPIMHEPVHPRPVDPVPGASADAGPVSAEPAPPEPVSDDPVLREVDAAPSVPPVHHEVSPPSDPTFADTRPDIGQPDHEDPPAALTDRRSRSVSSILGRIRSNAVVGPDTDGDTHAWPFDRPVAPNSWESDTAPMVPLDRGDMGEGRVGQTLEAARIHDLEVLHGLRLDAETDPIDHLVVCVNGVWVVRAVQALSGPLERRDVGDWFTADPRLYIDGEDQSSLIAQSRGQVAAVAALLARASFSDIPVRGVLCFGSVQPGWVKEPFVIDGISVTWRRHVVEPLLAPVLLDARTRRGLLHELAGATIDPATSEARGPVEDRAGVEDHPAAEGPTLDGSTPGAPMADDDPGAEDEAPSPADPMTAATWKAMAEAEASRAVEPPRREAI